MNRRTFLTTLSAAAAGFALDPERLLWVPGRKTIFLPPANVTIGGIERGTFMFWRNIKDAPLDYILLEGDNATRAWKKWDDAVKRIALKQALA